MDPIIIAVLGVVLVLLFGGGGIAFGRRRSSNNQQEPLRQRAGWQPSRRVDEKWYQTLNHEDTILPEPPRLVVQLSPNPKPILIIGIGDAGASVLDFIANRMDDVNGIGSFNHIKLMHLRMDSAMLSIPQKPYFSTIRDTALIEDLSLQSARSIAPEDLELPHWEWARLLGIPPSNENVGRHSARVVLYNHLRIGKNAPLLQNFAQKIRNVNQVFLVGSAIENVGASLMGDISALLRSRSQSSGYHQIDALVLADDGNADLQGDLNLEASYRTACLLELGRDMTETAVRRSFGPEIKYFHRNAALLNAVTLFWGKDGGARQQAANFLWNYITDDHAALALRACTTNVKPGTQQNPAISLSFNHALYWPSRFLGAIASNRLAKDILAHDKEPAELPCGELSNRGLKWATDYLRPDGLLPTVRGIARCSDHKEYLRSAEQRLERAHHRFTHAADEARQSLQHFYNVSHNLPYKAVLDLNSWGNFSYSPEDMQKARRLLGWTASDGLETETGSLRLAVARESRNKRVNDLYQTNFDNMAEYEFWVEKVAQLIVHDRRAEPLAGGMKATMGQPAFANLKNFWQELPNYWLEKQLANLVTGGYDAAPRLISTVINPAWNPPIHIESDVLDSVDPTSSILNLITQPIPLVNLSFMNLSQLAGGAQVHLIHETERVTADIFGVNGLYETPITLQKALVERQAMQLFFAYWLSGGEHYRHVLDASTTESWEDGLERFIDEFSSKANITNQATYAFYLRSVRQAILPDIIDWSPLAQHRWTDDWRVFEGAYIAQRHNGFDEQLEAILSQPALVRAYRVAKVSAPLTEVEAQAQQEKRGILFVFAEHCAQNPIPWDQATQNHPATELELLSFPDGRVDQFNKQLRKLLERLARGEKVSHYDMNF